MPKVIAAVNSVVTSAFSGILFNNNNNNNSLLNVRFGSLLGPRGLLLIYMWGENSI